MVKEREMGGVTFPSTITLLSLPDAKPVRKILTVGKRYHVFGTLGNGFVVLCDDMKTKAVVLGSRFSKDS